MTESLRDKLIRCGWASNFNVSTLVRLIEDHHSGIAKPTLYTYKVHQVLRVIDGDTMVVSIDLGFNLTLAQTIRIKGIDAPEARTINLEEKARGLSSKAFAESWLQGKSLLIRTYKDDKYGRMLGDFICTETSTTFAEAMLVANHAEVYGQRTTGETIN
jgi:endonuclease YncB( thermonuclease family)